MRIRRPIFVVFLAFCMVYAVVFLWSNPTTRSYLRLYKIMLQFPLDPVCDQQEDQLDRDIGYWEEVGGVTDEDVRKAEELLGEYATVIQIIDGELYLPESNDYRLAALRYILFQIMKRIQLPDVEMVLNLNDGANILKSDHPRPLPIWGSYSSDESWEMLLPNPCHFSWSTDYLQIYDANRHMKWRDRTTQMMWRGSTTGGRFSKENWKTFPRGYLVSLSDSRPDIIDAQFTGCDQCETPDAVKTVPAVSKQHNSRYQYLALVDGNTAPSSRSLWSFYTDSTVLKQDSIHKEFFYWRLKPYVHYIPFKNDMSDFVERLEWAMENPENSEKISAQSTQLVEEFLTPSKVHCYFAQAITRYAAVLKYKPTLREGLVKVSSASYPRYCW